MGLSLKSKPVPTSVLTCNCCPVFPKLKCLAVPSPLHPNCILYEEEGKTRHFALATTRGNSSVGFMEL